MEECFLKETKSSSNEPMLSFSFKNKTKINPSNNILLQEKFQTSKTNIKRKGLIYFTQMV